MEIGVKKQFNRLIEISACDRPILPGISNGKMQTKTVIAKWRGSRTAIESSDKSEREQKMKYLAITFIYFCESKICYVRSHFVKIRFIHLLLANSLIRIPFKSFLLLYIFVCVYYCKFRRQWNEKWIVCVHVTAAHENALESHCVANKIGIVLHVDMLL